MGIINILLDRGDKPSMILATLTLTYKRMFAIMTNDGDDDFLSESLGMRKSALFMARKNIDAAKRRTQGFLSKLKNTVIISMLWNTISRAVKFLRKTRLIWQ